MSKINAARLGSAVFEAEQSGRAPKVYDFELKSTRPLTQGEITKGKRYLARQEKRNEYFAEVREFEREKAERELRLDRIKADARKLATARLAINSMPTPEI